MALYSGFADLVFSADATGKSCEIFAQSCLEQTISRLKTITVGLKQSKLAFGMSHPYLSDIWKGEND